MSTMTQAELKNITVFDMHSGGFASQWINYNQEHRQSTA